jgi:hypothetical protein
MRAWEETWSTDAEGDVLRVEREGEDEHIDNIAEFCTHRWVTGDPKDFERASLAAHAPEMARFLIAATAYPGNIDVDAAVALLKRCGIEVEGMRHR